MKAFLVFLIVIVILALFCWRGWRRGLIMTLAGIIVFVAAFGVGGAVSDRFSEPFSTAIYPLICSPIENAGRVAIGLDEREEVEQEIPDDPKEAATLEKKAEKEAKRQEKNPTPKYDGTVKSAAYLTLLEIGFADTAADRISDEVADEVSTVNADLFNVVSKKVAGVIAYLLVFVLVTVVILIAAGAVTNLFNLNFHLRGHNTVDTIGGAVAGIVLGIVVLYGVGWILRFAGAFFPDLIENTIMGKFTTHNIFTKFMGL